MFLWWTLPSICHRTYFHTSKGHVTWIIKNVNRIPTHCGVAYESVGLLARGHVIRIWETFSIIILFNPFMYRDTLAMSTWFNMLWGLHIYWSTDAYDLDHWGYVSKWDTASCSPWWFWDIWSLFALLLCVVTLLDINLF